LQLCLQGKTHPNRYELPYTGEIVAIKLVDFDKVKGTIQKRLIKN
jgi:hypothetical protein